MNKKLAFIQMRLYYEYHKKLLRLVPRAMRGVKQGSARIEYVIDELIRLQRKTRP